jgi:DNA-binding MarR family transcriptional regulator
MPNNHFKSEELYSVINGIASSAIARRLQKHFREATLDVTIEQWSILYHLWQQDCISQQELCKRTYRDKPSMTRLIDNLEKQKLVKRIASKEDRRKNLVCLTQSAKDLQHLTVDMANQTMDEALAGLTKNEIETAKKVLYKVYENLKSGKD